jgi:hypothetical protein
VHIIIIILYAVVRASSRNVIRRKFAKEPSLLILLISNHWQSKYPWINLNILVIYKIIIVKIVPEEDRENTVLESITNRPVLANKKACKLF